MSFSIGKFVREISPFTNQKDGEREKKIRIPTVVGINLEERIIQQERERDD